MPDPISKLQRDFGACVRANRKKRKLSQEELAFEAGISTTYMGEIERGEKMPSLDVVLRVAKALKLTGSELLKAGGF